MAPLLLAGAWLLALGASAQPPGTVYLVMGSDTAIWNAGWTVDVYSPHPYYSQSSFTDTNSPSFKVMDPAWRGRFKDSFGQTIKFTWWMMGGNIYRAADNLNVPEPNTMTLYLMKKYHGAAIRQFGDELSLHYHTFLWSDYNGTGHYYWNQSRTFAECRDDFDVTLAQYLLDEDVFPVSFRSGWHYMDNGWQQYLNTLLPYSMDDNYGAYLPWYTNSLGPVGGVEDWSHAPSAFVPFHPSTSDYQVPGDGAGWNVRCIKMPVMRQVDMDHLFAQASNGVDQVACLWDHLPEDFVANVQRIAGLIAVACTNYPTVPFRYCTAVEAMQRWRGTTNWPPPQIDVQQDIRGQQVTLRIHTSTAIFQPQPFVALRDCFDRYTNPTSLCEPSGSNAWSLVLPVPLNRVAKVGIAVTDLAGNLATRLIRYLPDDLFIDDLDAQFSGLQGDWVSSTNAAWGTDARIARLGSNMTAQVQWSLPISSSGAYSIFVQVPPIENAASNVVFDLSASGSNLCSASFSAALPADQWIYLCATNLDPAVTNVLRMSVSGTNQPGTYAVADVVRVVPLAEAAPSLSIEAAASPVVLLIRGQPGQTCQLQRSASLTSAWTTLETLTLPGDGALQYEDKSPPSGMAYYRTVVGGALP